MLAFGFVTLTNTASVKVVFAGWLKFFPFLKLTDCFSVPDAFDPIRSIRQLYEDREGWLAPFPWCKEFRFNLDNIFTRLIFVSRRKERGIKTGDIVDMF